MGEFNGSEAVSDGRTAAAAFPASSRIVCRPLFLKVLSDSRYQTQTVGQSREFLSPRMLLSNMAPLMSKPFSKNAVTVHKENVLGCFSSVLASRTYIMQSVSKNALFFYVEHPSLRISFESKSHSQLNIIIRQSRKSAFKRYARSKQQVRRSRKRRYI